jgi:hypothetical protein
MANVPGVMFIWRASWKSYPWRKELVNLLEDGHIVTPGRLDRLATIVRDAVIRVYDETGDVIEMHEHKGEFKEW